MPVNNQTDDFSRSAKEFDSPHTLHKEGRVIAGVGKVFDSANPSPRGFYACGAGFLRIVDAAGNSADYEVVTGVYVLAAGAQSLEVGSTADCIPVW